MSQVARPRPISNQNRRVLPDVSFTQTRNATVARNSRTFCRMSPNAVSTKLRGTTRDTAICRPTSMQIARVHFRPACSTAHFTKELYGCKKNVKCYCRNRRCESEGGGCVVTKEPSRIAAQSCKHHETSCTAEPAQLDRHRARANLQ